LFIAYGYQSKESLSPVLRAWLHLLATLDVDHVVADFAPTALFASRLLPVSSVMIGNGFTVSPKLHSLPGFRPWRNVPEKTAKDEAKIFVNDQILIRSINQSFAELGFAGFDISSSYEVYAHADQWLMTVPEMDHYGRRDLPYVVR